MTEVRGADGPVRAVDSSAARRRMRRVGRVSGLVLIALGIAMLLWAFVVWRYGDPVTGLYMRIEQHRLSNTYDAHAKQLEGSWIGAPVRTTPSPRQPPPFGAVRAHVERAAAAYRREVRPGDPIGRISVSRLGLRAVLVEGTGHDELRRGPGRDARTWMPGQHELIYVAGHRTTYGAPFANIDRLRAGDQIGVSVPYGVFTYTVTSHVIVDASDLRALQSRGREEIALQACHPRFRATQRYIVYARLAEVKVRTSEKAWTTYTVRTASA